MTTAAVASAWAVNNELKGFSFCLDGAAVGVLAVVEDALAELFSVPLWVTGVLDHLVRLLTESRTQHVHVRQRVHDGAGEDSSTDQLEHGHLHVGLKKGGNRLIDIRVRSPASVVVVGRIRLVIGQLDV